MIKKLALWLVCLAAALALAGCATVNENNSFQSKAPGEVAVTGETQPTDAQSTNAQSTNAQPTAAQPSAQPAEATAAPAATDAPTPTPPTPGYNG
jgi:hypothetical protein